MSDDTTKLLKACVEYRAMVDKLEAENAELRRDVYQCPPTSENDYEGFKWSDACEELERENAALRELTSTLGAPNHINIPVEKWRELRADKERLDWLLTDDGGFWVNWMYDKDEWTPELKASRDAIDACRNGRIRREKP